MGKQWKQWKTLFWGALKSDADGDWSHEIKRRLLLGRKAMTNLDSILKSRHDFANKGPSSQGYGFSSGHVWMWELDYKEGWALKNWCFWTVVLEKTLESPLDCKEIKSVHPKGNQSWVFIGRTDIEAETPILWPPDVMSWLTGKAPGAGKDWGQEEKGTAEDEIVGWHHWFNGHEFEQALGDGDGHGSLVCCSPWSHKELDMTERLNWTELNHLALQRVQCRKGVCRHWHRPCQEMQSGLSTLQLPLWFPLKEQKFKSSTLPLVFVLFSSK